MIVSSFLQKNSKKYLKIYVPFELPPQGTTTFIEVCNSILRSVLPNRLDETLFSARIPINK